MTALHYFWLLLPLLFVGFYISGKIGVISNVRIPGKRHEDSLRTAGFCFFTLIFAVMFDIVFFAEWIEDFLAPDIEPIIFHWLLYPAFLLLFAMLEPFMPWYKPGEGAEFDKDSDDDERSKRVKFIT